MAGKNPFYEQDEFKIPKHSNTIFTWEKLWANDPLLSPWTRPVMPPDYGHAVALADIGKFELLNPQYRIVVIGFDETEFMPLRSFRYRHENRKPIDEFRVIVLFLYKNHYFWITSIKRLFSNKRVRNGNDYPCYFCWNHIRGKERWKVHLENCAMFPVLWFQQK